jgi:hypothetical protein
MRCARASVLLSLVSLAAFASTAGSSGCFRPDDTLVNYSSAATGAGLSGQGGEGGVSGLTPKEFFDQNVREGLVNSCSGADCHSSGTVAFLLAGQEYAAITTYVSSVGSRFIVEAPANSMLITYPPNSEHPGIGWDGIETLRDTVLQWLTLEAQLIEPETVLEIGPVEPDGLTILPLDSLGSGLKGVTLSFYAIEVGSPPTALQLSSISVWPPNRRGLRMLNPSFVVVPPGKPEVVNNSFHGDAHTFVAPDAVQLGTGELILTTWEQGAQMLIRFESLSILFADSEGEVFDPCSRADLFTQGVDALPVQGSANSANGLLYCAQQCHGGSQGLQPTTVMNLSALLEQPHDDDFACAVARLHITPTNVDDSAMMATTDPSAGGTHPFIFGGNGTSHNAFKNAMRNWIELEGAQ